MDQEIATETAEVSWPELSADLTLARTQARSIMLDTQRANSDGRILELAAQLELMRTRMTSLEQHLFESQTGVAQDLIERLGNIDSALHATELRFNGFAERISAAEEFASTTMLSTTTAIDARIDAAEVARRAQSTELEELSSFLEQAFTRIAELSDLVDAERDITATSRRDDTEQFTALTSKVSSVEQSISDLDVRIDEAADRVEEASHQALEELKRSITAGSARIDQANARIDGHSARLDESTEQLDQHGVRLDEWAERIDENTNRINTTVSQVGTLENGATTTNERIAALDLQLEQQASTQDEIASAIHFLQSRAEALEAGTATHASEMVEKVGSTNRRLDQGFAELAALRGQIESAEPEVSAELVDALEARLAANETEQRAIVRTLDEATAGLEARTQQQEAVLEAHSNILESTTQLLTDHHAIAASNAAAIAEVQAHSAAQEQSVAGTTHAIADLVDRSDNTMDRIDETDGKIAELEQLATEAKGEVAELSDRVDATHDQVTELNQRVDTTRGQVTELNQRVHAQGSEVDELSDRVSKAEHTAQQAIVAAASSASTSETVLRTKTAELESRLEEATERIDSLDLPAPNDSEATERVAALEPRIDAHTEQLDAVNEHIAALEPRIDAHTEQLDAVNDQIATLEPRIDTHTEQLAALDRQSQEAEENARATEDRLSALDDWSTEVDGRILEIENKASQAIDAAAVEPSASTDEVQSLNSRIDELDPKVSVHDEKIDAVNDWVTVVDGRIIDIQDQGNTTQKQIEAVNDWVTDLDSRSNDTDALARDLGDRTGEIDQRTSQLEARVEETARRIDQIDEERAEFSGDISGDDLSVLAEQLQAATPRLDVHDQKIEAINDWVTIVDGRILEIHDQGTSAEEQFEAINDWVTVVDGRILEIQRNGETVQEQIAAVNDWSTALDGRIIDIQEQGNTTQRQIEAVNDWVTVVDGRILELNDSGEVVQEQIEAVNDWATNLEIRSYEMETRLSQAQQVLVEMTKKLTVLFERDQPDAGLKRQVDELAAATAQLQAKANEPSAAVDSDALAEQVAAAERSVADLESTVSEWIRNVEQAGTNATNELRDFMVYRIDTAEDRIDRRLADIEASGAGNERLEAIERAVAEADDRARDAYAFSENLRLLQTDLVQAIRGEMATQAAQIDQHSQALQNGKVPTFASQPSDQVAAVNARVDEVTRGLRHLNDLQERHGAIEAKLTETVTASNASLGQARQDVATLQTALQAALARIDRLEAQVAAGQQQL